MGIFDSPDDERSGPFTVLFVCTGNICRSPQAEVLLQARLADAAGRLAALDAQLAHAVRADIRVESAGIHALVGSAPPDEVLALTTEHGADASAHRGRQLDASIVDAADLILVMEREQRRRVVSDHPQATKRAFTLPEFAHWARAFTLDDEVVASGSPSLTARLREALPEIAAQRALVAPLAGDAADIADPYRRSMDDYRVAASTISAAVDAMVAAFLRVAMWAPERS